MLIQYNTEALFTTSNSAFPTTHKNQKHIFFRFAFTTAVMFRVIYNPPTEYRTLDGIRGIVCDTHHRNRDIWHKQDVKCDAPVLNVLNLYFLVPVVKKKKNTTPLCSILKEKKV